MKNSKTYLLKSQIWDLVKLLYPLDINTSLDGSLWTIYRAFKIQRLVDTSVVVFDTAIQSEWITDRHGVERPQGYYNIQNLFTLSALLADLESKIIKDIPTEM